VLSSEGLHGEVSRFLIVSEGYGILLEKLMLNRYIVKRANHNVAPVLHLSVRKIRRLHTVPSQIVDPFAKLILDEN